MAMHYCEFCQMDHSSMSCYHPGKQQVEHLQAEVKLLKQGGCARDQRTTQFCAEAVAAISQRGIAEAKANHYAAQTVALEAENTALKARLEKVRGLPRYRNVVTVSDDGAVTQHFVADDDGGHIITDELTEALK